MNSKRLLTVLVAVLVVGGVPTALAASTAGTHATTDADVGDAAHVQNDAVGAQDETTTEEDDEAGADDETEEDDGTDADDGANETTAAGESLVTNVTFEDQTSNGSAVVVRQVAIQTTKPPGGFVSIHLAENVTGDETNVTEEMIGPRIGNSSFLDPGEYRNLTVELTETLAEDTTLIAVVHQDAQSDEQFDLEADQPFEVDDQIVADAANVTVSATDDGEVTVGEETTEDEEEA